MSNSPSASESLFTQKSLSADPYPDPLARQWDELTAGLRADPQINRRELLRIKVLIARQRYAETRRQLQLLQDAQPRPLWQHWLGLVAQAAGDFESARAWLLQEQDSLPLFDARARAANAYALAQLALAQDRLPEAIDCLRSCLLQSRFASAPDWEGRARQLLGQISQQRQKPELARDYYLSARDAFVRSRHETGLTEVNRLLAGLPGQSLDAC